MQEFRIKIDRGVFRTSDHRSSFGPRSQIVGTNIVRFADCSFYGHIVLQVFCEFGPDRLSRCGETE
jgi:hypothetical protein